MSVAFIAVAWAINVKIDADRGILCDKALIISTNRLQYRLRSLTECTLETIFLRLT